MTAAACGDDDSDSAGGGGDSVSVGYVLPGAADPFYREVAKGALAEAKNHNDLDLNFQSPTGPLDVQKYVAAMEDVSSTGIEAFALDPYDAELFTPIMQRLIDQGIPVVNQGNPDVPGVDEATIVNTDTEGAMAAGMKSMVDAMGGEGAVGLLEFPGNIVVTKRIELAKTALEEAGIEVVASAPMDCTRVKGANATQDMLQAHSEITGIFAGCGLPGVGAAEAVDQAGEDVVVYSFDGGVDELASIREGKLDGAIRQRPQEIGAKVVQVLEDLARDEPVKDEYLTGFDVVTSVNVKEFE
jgi:ABC-type sugar transport system substrate-binding protein